MKLYVDYKIGRLDAVVSVIDGDKICSYKKVPASNMSTLATQLAELSVNSGVETIYINCQPMDILQGMINNLIMTKYHKNQRIKVEYVE